MLRASLAFSLLLLAGCMDKAKADYDKCVELDRKYDVAGAVTACQAAVAADSKSPSGQAAAKKLIDLQTVSDKMKVEQQEKSAREAKIAKKEDPLVVVHAPTAPAASVATPFAQAQAFMDAGDVHSARNILQPRAREGTATPEEMKLLLKICKQEKDKACLAMLAKAGVR